MKNIHLIGLFVIQAVGAEKLTSEILMQRIQSSNQSELQDVVNQGAEQSNKLDSMALVLLSAVSLKAEDYEYAALFLNQGRIRAAIDRKIFPPVRTGGNSPLLPIMAVKNQLTSAINDNVQKNPELHQSMIGLFKEWQPVCDLGYNPGWEYTGQPDYQACKAQFIEYIGNNVKALEQMSRFYTHPEYFTLLKEWNEAKMKFLLSRVEDEDEIVKNMENRLHSIEKELGVQGPISKYKKLEFNQK